MNALCDGTLVFSHPGALGDEEASRVMAALQEQFPGHRIVVLEEGCELVCVSATEDERGGGDEQTKGPDDVADSSMSAAVPSLDVLNRGAPGNPRLESRAATVAREDRADVSLPGPLVRVGVIPDEVDDAPMRFVAAGSPSPRLDDFVFEAELSRGTNRLVRMVGRIPERAAITLTRLIKATLRVPEPEHSAVLATHGHSARKHNRFGGER